MSLFEYLGYLITNRIWWLCIAIYFFGMFRGEYGGWWWPLLAGFVIAGFIVPQPEDCD